MFPECYEPELSGGMERWLVPSSFRLLPPFVAPPNGDPTRSDDERAGRATSKEDLMVNGMFEDLSRAWGWIALRGFVSVAFGIAALAWPGLTLAVLVLVWGAYAFADGIVALIAGLKFKMGGKPMWPLVLLGLVGIVAGVITFLRPGVAEIALLAFVATWAILIGLLQIFGAIALRKVITNEWWMALSGLLSVVFGVIVLMRPQAGALAIVVIIAWYAIVYGVVLLMLGFRLKSLTARIPRPA